MANSKKRSSETTKRSSKRTKKRATSRSPKYGKAAQRSVESALHRAKRGNLKSGSGRHPKVKSRKQAIAIGLSEARAKGAKVPRKSRKTSTRRRTSASA